jgi:hypothetical protein
MRFIPFINYSSVTQCRNGPVQEMDDGSVAHHGCIAQDLERGGERGSAACSPAARSVEFPVNPEEQLASETSEGMATYVRMHSKMRAYMRGYY